MGAIESLREICLRNGLGSVTEQNGAGSLTPWHSILGGPLLDVILPEFDFSAFKILYLIHSISLYIVQSLVVF